MPGKVSLSVATNQAAGVAFSATVSVTNVPVGASITATVSLSRPATDPAWTQPGAQTAMGPGTVSFTFSSLKLSASAILLADANDDQSSYYAPDAEGVQVP